jgi:hypothetical protein
MNEYVRITILVGLLFVAAIVADRFAARRVFRPRVFDLHGKSARIVLALSEAAANGAPIKSKEAFKNCREEM